MIAKLLRVLADALQDPCKDTNRNERDIQRRNLLWTHETSVSTRSFTSGDACNPSLSFSRTSGRESSTAPSDFSCTAQIVVASVLIWFASSSRVSTFPLACCSCRQVKCSVQGCNRAHLDHLDDGGQCASCGIEARYRRQREEVAPYVEDLLGCLQDVVDLTVIEYIARETRHDTEG